MRNKSSALKNTRKPSNHEPKEPKKGLVGHHNFESQAKSKTVRERLEQ